nr:hypothetical protein [Tanacetum cinerariifolium]
GLPLVGNLEQRKINASGIQNNEEMVNLGRQKLKQKVMNSHVQTDDELSEKELKQIEADDQAIQTILLILPEDIYAAVDSCETAQEIRL